MFGQHKRMSHEFTGVLTGKGLEYGGSLIRSEATGYGVVYMLENMLQAQGNSTDGKTVAISGSGNVATFACEKVTQLGGKVVTLSDSSGFIHDVNGIDADKLAYVMDLKNVRRGRISEYADEFGCDFHKYLSALNEPALYKSKIEINNLTKMDPITQGVLGSIACQNISRKKFIVVASALGFLSGMSADLDILIRSDTDPMLFLEYHRQFTHSLIFIPVGGLICSAIFYCFLRNRFSFGFGQFYLYCTSGYATHALLDACTSYGTQLFWPFSDMRISWNTISIVDPLFTFPLLVLVVTAATKKQPGYARAAAVWVVVYMSIGLLQQHRATERGWELALSRGHEPVSLQAKPGFGNILMWKVIYEFEDRFYIDGVRMGIRTKVYPGDSIKKLDVENDFPWLIPDSQHARDLERFRWFSDDYVAIHPRNPNRVIDIRYSMVPNRIDAFWMIELDQSSNPGQHVSYVHEHDNTASSLKNYWKMILD